MSVTRLLIANRGEIAIRIARAAADMRVPTVAVHSEDDSHSLHLRAADDVRALPGQGAAAYLDAGAVIAAARASGFTSAARIEGAASAAASNRRQEAENGFMVGSFSPWVQTHGRGAGSRGASEAQRSASCRARPSGTTQSARPIRSHAKSARRSAGRQGSGRSISPKENAR